MSSYPDFGTVSHGTLRTADLLDAFASELEHCLQRFGAEKSKEERERLQKVIGDARELDPDAEHAPETVNELMDELNAFAPPYAYFGAIEGDGSDFGFWPAISALEDAARDGEVLKVSDLASIGAGYRGELMLVSDHGNVTFGYVDNAGEFQETWSVV